MDGMGCPDNIQHPKPTDYSTYKYQNFGSARPTAPAPAGQQGDDPIVARAASSTATAARNATHCIVRTLTRTTQTPPAVSPCDHAIAHSNPTSIAKRPSRAQIRLVDRARLGSLSAVNDELGSDWPFRKLPVALADQVVRGEVPAQGMRNTQTQAYRPTAQRSVV